MRRTTKLVMTLCVATIAAFGITGTAAAQHQAGDSLVNVQIGDVTVQVPVGIAANLCDINVNVLAQQIRTGDATCEAVADPDASAPGQGNGSGHQAGDSLVNVQIGDVTIQLPIAVAANVCDVNVNILARQLRTGDATCEAVATPDAGT